MLIAPYEISHEMPFRSRPSQPNELFSQEKYALFTCNVNPAHASEEGIQTLPNFWIWPILMGIDAIDMPRVMAHVYAPCLHPIKEMRTFHKHLTVQFTTLPEKTISEIPLVVENNRATVSLLWEADQGTWTVWNALLGEFWLPKNWQQYFTMSLRHTKTQAFEAMQEAHKKLRLLEAIT